MRALVVSLLFAGCISQHTPIETDLLRAPPLTIESATLPPMLSAKIGLEVLSRPQRGGDEPPAKLKAARPKLKSEHKPRAPRTGEFLNLSEEHISSLDDTAQRMTLRFVSDLIGDDHRRVQRRLGVPVMSAKIRTVSPHMAQSQFAEREREEQDAFIARYQGALLNHPLRAALREIPIVREFDLALEDFKSENVPLSNSADERGDSFDWGRISMNVRASLDNPVELGWVRRGFTVASDTERLRVSLGKHATDKLFTSVRTVYGYDNHQFDVWADLQYQIDANTRFSLLLGDSINLMNGSMLYPMVESPIQLPEWDRSLGIVFFVEHFF